MSDTTILKSLRISEEAHRELLEHIFSQKRRIHGEIRPFVESAIREKIQRDREKEAKEKIKRKPPK